MSHRHDNPESPTGEQQRSRASPDMLPYLRPTSASANRLRGRRLNLLPAPVNPQPTPCPGLDHQPEWPAASPGWTARVSYQFKLRKPLLFKPSRMFASRREAEAVDRII